MGGKMRTKVTIKFLLVLILLVGCTTVEKAYYIEEEENEDKEIEVSIEQIAKNVEMKDLFLPFKNSKPRTEEITHVMIHFMSNVSNNPHEPYVIKDIYSLLEGYGVSAHYVIDRDGEIYRFVPEERAAFHAGKGHLPYFLHVENKLNDYSIGIELLAIGTREEMLQMLPDLNFDLIDPTLIGYTDEQYDSLNALLGDIFERNPSIRRDRTHVVGHDEYAPGRKTDPGSLFDWSRIEF